MSPAIIIVARVVIRGAPPGNSITASYLARNLKNFLTHAGKKIDRELVQPLVGQPLLADGLFVEDVRQQCGRAFPRIASSTETAIPAARDLMQYGLYFCVRIPARCFFLQHQIGPHAAPRKVFHSAIIFRAISMLIEMTRP